MANLINLLPPREKENLVFLKYLRLSLILGILFLTFLMVFSLVLFSIKGYILAELEFQQSFLQEKERIIALGQNTEKEIIESNDLFSNLLSFYQQNKDFVPLLERLQAILPPEIYLQKLSLVPVGEQGREKIHVSLSGFSPERNLLLELKELLEKEGGFSKVYFSPNSWVKPRDINFSVSFEVD